MFYKNYGTQGVSEGGLYGYAGQHGAVDSEGSHILPDLLAEGPRSFATLRILKIHFPLPVKQEFSLQSEHLVIVAAINGRLQYRDENGIKEFKVDLVYSIH